MDETDLTQTLEDRRQLDAARGPGCYALVAGVPDSAQSVIDRWHDAHDAAPDEDVFARLAAAETALYVGAASNVYERLCDHAGDVRKAAFLSAFPPTALHSLWPKDSAEVAFCEEKAVGRALSGAATRVWTDGDLL